jgi:hypothetical protein
MAVRLSVLRSRGFAGGQQPSSPTRGLGATVAGTRRATPLRPERGIVPPGSRSASASASASASDRSPPRTTTSDTRPPLRPRRPQIRRGQGPPTHRQHPTQYSVQPEGGPGASKPKVEATPLARLLSSRHNIHDANVGEPPSPTVRPQRDLAAPLSGDAAPTRSIGGTPLHDVREVRRFRGTGARSVRPAVWVRALVEDRRGAAAVGVVQHGAADVGVRRTGHAWRATSGPWSGR